MVQDGFNCIRYDWCNTNLHTSEVANGSIDYTQNSDLVGLTTMQIQDKIIAYAGQIGLKVILCHHNDEGLNGGDQQRNGLWYDLGPGTDGTDGAGDTGTVTAQGFQDDWVAMAQRYAGNSTVIGCDLDNEPHNMYGGNDLNWGKGDPSDIWAMFTNVGNAIEAVDPGILVICEGAMDVTDKNSIIWWMMDLTHVATKPVVLNIPNKVVYSVHEYPTEVDGISNDTGAAYIARMNEDWGYIVTRNIAPVWVGEMGEALTSTDTDGLAWFATIAPYLNGQDGKYGGPTFHGNQQPISTSWWFWGTFNDSDPWSNGTLLQWNPTQFNPANTVATNQLLWNSPPTITSVSETIGLAGDTIVITGTNFYNVQKVSFTGNASVTFTVNSPTSITTKAPANGWAGPIKVVTLAGTANSPSTFSYLAPTITLLSETSGLAVDSVTITGTNFTGVTSVKFGGIPAVYAVSSSTSIVAIAPSNGISGPVTVTTAGGAAMSAQQFTYNAPTITSFSPTSGSVGTSVTITGTNLIGMSWIKLNGTSVTGWTRTGTTTVKTTVPTGATTGTIVIMTSGGTAISPTAFTVY
jgi:endoglucanase/chitinase